MKRLLTLAAAVVLAACEPSIPNTPPPTVITARLDLTVNPPVAPAPNDLATDPTTGLLAIPLAADASAADAEFADYLDTLDGFPASSSAGTTFDAKLSAASVTDATVKVVDVTDNFADVAGVTRAYADTGDTTAPGAIQIAPPATGWLPGHTYAVLVVGGDSGVKGGNGEKVVGSANWALLRSASSLLDCSHNQQCQASTALIPSAETDPAKRAADTLAKATQLEDLRLKYKPLLDHFDGLGIKRADVAIAWSFKISDDTKMGFYPTAVPPIVPTPNDLAIDPTTGLVNAPVDPNSPAAEQEFTTDYLNTLNGFPVAADGAAVVMLGELDPNSVSPTNVLVFNALTGEPELASVTYVPGSSTALPSIVVSPPTEGWGKSKDIAVVITSGVTRPDGAPVVGTEVWALARSSAPLVDCTDLSVPANCHPTLTLAPLSQDQAVQLEALRRGYAPVLDALDAMGVPRSAVPLMWTFRTVDQPEAVFDPAGGVVPFPSDLVYDPVNNKVNLPVPAGAPPALQQLIMGLNTLDGFSTTAPAVSENSDLSGAIDLDQLDPASLDAGTRLIAVPNPDGGLAAHQPNWTACLGCRSTTDSMGNTNVLLADGGVISPAPQQLQFVPLTPLEEQRRYAAVLTTDLTDTQGRHVMASITFALMRSKAPLLDGNGHSTISVVSDAQATALEPYRAGLSPLFDFLDLLGMPRKNLALAWTYRTQSTVSVLGAMQNLVSVLGAAGALPSTPSFAYPVGNAAIFAQMTAAGIPHNALAEIYVGNVTVPFALTGPGGTLNPAGVVNERTPFILTIPAGTPPAGGWPVTLFGHGITGDHKNLLAFSNAMGTIGHATIGIDAVWHGDRTSCNGLGAYLTQVLGTPVTDDAACADPATMKCDAASGRCIARTGTGVACTPGATDPLGDGQCFLAGQTAAGPQGLCLASGFCEGGDFKRDASGDVTVSGWNMIRLDNFFAFRDNWRNAVIDDAQLVRVLSDATAGGLNAWVQNTAGGGSANYQLNGAAIDYVGMSMGGFEGAMAASVNGNLRHVGLNVPGSDYVLLLLASPTLVPYRNAFEAQLAPLGLVPGTPGFDSFLGLAQMIVDPADPRNAIDAAVNSSATGRETFIQYIHGDQFVINPTTLELIGAGSRGTAMPQVFEFMPPAGYDPGKLHPFFLDPTGDANYATDCNPATAGFPMDCLTAQAQGQMAKFILTGNYQ